MPYSNTPKISVIITTYNEAQTIISLLTALKKQKLKPTEVIIVDNFSTDGTDQLISQFAKKNPKLKIKLISKYSNRSLGRNLAIHKTKHELIAITDAGCIPQKTWLQELYKTYEDGQKKYQKENKRQVDNLVVAGFYKGKAETIFEQAVIPYALVMPDRVNPQTFLPATRSMLLPKRVWQKIGGFDEKLNFSEDYHFAHQLKKSNVPILFAKKAVVEWLPKKTWWEFCMMIFNMARGDILANTWRLKVVLVFTRYLLGLIIWWTWPAVAIALAIIYLIWAVAKNYRYVPDGWYYLPLLQISADLAVMLGTMVGVLDR